MSADLKLMETITAAHWLDLAGLAGLLFGMIQGAIRGFSGEIARLVGLVAAVALAIFLREPFGSWIGTRLPPTENPRAADVIAFTIILAFTLVVLILLRRSLRKFIRLVVAPPADILLGIPCGGLRIALVVMLALLVLKWLPFPETYRMIQDQTRTGRILHPAVARLQNRLARYPAVAGPANALSDAAAALQHPPDEPRTENATPAPQQREIPEDSPEPSPLP